MHRNPRSGTARRVHRPARQQGAALVIGLVLLVILTLLAFAGANTASTELVMAGNEQFRRNAALAANAGVEEAIARLGEVPTVATAPVTRRADEAVAGSAVDRYTTETRFVGEEAGLPQLSEDKFVGLHYVIESSGTSARGANDLQRQGVFVVAATGSAAERSFERIGAGLP